MSDTKRASTHNGHVKGNRKHNDRNFNVKQANHIDPKRVKENVYVSYASGERVEFREADKNGFYETTEDGRFFQRDENGNKILNERGQESLFNASGLAFYERRYGEALALQNEKHKAARNYKRIKSMQDVFKGRATGPEERIIQYGNIETPEDELPTVEQFKIVTENVVKRLNEWSAAHGNHLHVLNYAIHADEATTHVHLCNVWDYVDDDGVIQIGQDKALEASGVPLPDPNEPKGRHNNRKMTFDAMYRGWVLDEWEALGFQVERTPVPDANHYSTKAYARKKAVELAQREENCKRREAHIVKMQQINNRAYDKNQADREENERVKEGLEKEKDAFVKEKALERRRIAQKEKKLDEATESTLEIRNELKTALNALKVGHLQYTNEQINEYTERFITDIERMEKAGKMDARTADKRKQTAETFRKIVNERDKAIAEAGEVLQKSGRLLKNDITYGS